MKRSPLPVLMLFLAAGFPASAAEIQDVQCEGTYRHHLQGVCTDGDSLYWSFTTRLVKTDLRGRVQQAVEVANHHGDLCSHDGKIYVAVNLGKFNQPAGQADSWVYVYDAAKLELAGRHSSPEVVHGAGGIAVRDGRFYVVGGLPPGIEENYVYEYDPDFKFKRRHILDSGYTLMGIQTAAFAHDRWWFGCYGDPKTLLTADPDFRNVKRFQFDCSLGIEALPEGQLLVGGGRCSKETGCTGQVQIARPHDETGLQVEPRPGR